MVTTNLEQLEVFSINDGVGAVVASWVEVSTIEGVPKVQRIIIISNEEARLLAKELNAAVAPVLKAYMHVSDGTTIERACGYECMHSCHSDVSRTTNQVCPDCEHVVAPDEVKSDGMPLDCDCPCHSNPPLTSESFTCPGIVSHYFVGKPVSGTARAARTPPNSTCTA